MAINLTKLDAALVKFKSAMLKLIEHRVAHVDQDIASNALVTIDIEALLGTNVAKYDPKSIRVENQVSDDGGATFYPGIASIDTTITGNPLRVRITNVHHTTLRVRTFVFIRRSTL